MASAVTTSARPRRVGAGSSSTNQRDASGSRRKSPSAGSFESTDRAAATPAASGRIPRPGVIHRSRATSAKSTAHSAAAELWAVLFALVALDLWITPGRGIRPLAAGVAAALSVLSKEPALGLFLLLPLASRWFVDEEPAPTRRGRALVVTALAMLAVIGALQIRSAFAHGPGDPYALGGVADVAGNLLRSLGWAVWPWPGSIPPGWLARILGGMVLAVVGVLAVRRARRDDPRVLFLGLLALVSLAPTVVLRDHQYTYYALLANVAVAAIFGLEIGPRIDRRLRSTTPRGAALVGASVLVGAASIVGVSARVHARGEDGLLVDPILRRSS